TSAITKNTAAQYSMTPPLSGLTRRENAPPHRSADNTPGAAVPWGAGKRPAQGRAAPPRSRGHYSAQGRALRRRRVPPPDEAGFNGAPVHVGEEGLDVLGPVLRRVVQHE